MWGPLCTAIGAQGGEAVRWEDHAVSGLYHCSTPLVKTFTCCCYRSMHVASTPGEQAVQVKRRCIGDGGWLALDQVDPPLPRGGSEWSDSADSDTLSDSEEGD